MPVRISLALLSCATVLAISPNASASDEVGVDGVYGRFHADTTLSLDVGGGLGLANNALGGAFDANFRMRYLDMTGFFVGFDDVSGSHRNDAISLGVDFRPLMLARIFKDWEQGPRWLDLMLDSIGLDMGVGVTNVGEPWGSGSGFSYVLGGGLELPIAWSQGTALMLRFGVRWIHAAGWDAQGTSGSDSALFLVSIVGRTMVRLGLLGVH